MNRFKKNSILYEWISCIIPNKIYFGPIPNEYLYEQLLEHSFTVIVNVTENEILNSIKTIHFPITDNSIPENSGDYCAFIYQLKKEVENGEKIYIHCRAGHSRSSMVVVSLLCCMYNKELKEVIHEVIECHKSRIMLRNIWRHRSPFNYKQFTFLYHIHKNIYIDKDNKVYKWLSPKNIWIDKFYTLEDYVSNQFVDHNYLFEMMKNNHFFLHKIKNTFLKKLTFLCEKGEYYNNLFRFFREHL